MQKKLKKIVDFIRQLYNTPEGIIPLHDPVFNGNEKKYLEECIDTTFVSSIGQFVNKLEDKIAKYTGSKEAVACVNGTSALHIALRIIGVTLGHEVITQPLTFISTANAISYCGAEPIFIDVDFDTLGLSPEKLEYWLKKNALLKKGQNLPINKTTGKIISAVTPMHTFGHPCRIKEIIEICDNYNLPVVEDAAESLGSYFMQKHTGTFGSIGVLSFNGNKIITTGGGGMIITNNNLLSKIAKHTTTQAKVPHKWEYTHDMIGYNYRMPNVNAALGLAQFENLDTFISKKRKLSAEYKNFFDEIGIDFFTEPKHAYSNYWLNTIILKNKTERNKFLEYTNSNGVMTRPAWHLINKLKMYKYCQAINIDNAEWLAERIVNIPSSIIL